MVRVDIHVTGDFGSHCFRIACKHDDFVDAQPAHAVQGLLHARTNGVLNDQEAHVFPIAGDVQEVLAPGLVIRCRHSFDTFFIHEAAAADEDLPAFIAFKIRHRRFHTAGDDGFRRIMRRRLPALGVDVFLDGYSQRMDRVHFCRSGEEDHFLIIDAFDRFDMVDLRNAHGNGPGLIEDDRVDVGQVFDVVATFDEDPFAGGYADGRGNRRRCRQFQAAREIDE